MEINLLILGTLFILTLFTVGESIYKHFKVHKIVLLLILLTLIVGAFLPPIEVFDFIVSFDKIILPGALSFVLLFMVKKFSRFMFSLLFSALVSMFYLIAGADAITFAVQPFILLGVFLGVFAGLNSVKISETLPSLFFGINLGAIIFFISKYESLETLFYETTIFSAVLISWIVSTLVLFLKQKMFSISPNYQGQKF
jgi:hypothetical protein